MQFAFGLVLVVCLITFNYFILPTVDANCQLAPQQQQQGHKRIARADDDDEPSEEEIAAVRAALDKRPKVARPAYSGFNETTSLPTPTPAPPKPEAPGATPKGGPKASKVTTSPQKAVIVESPDAIKEVVNTGRAGTKSLQEPEAEVVKEAVPSTVAASTGAVAGSSKGVGREGAKGAAEIKSAIKSGTKAASSTGTKSKALAGIKGKIQRIIQDPTTTNSNRGRMSPSARSRWLAQGQKGYYQ